MSIVQCCRNLVLHYSVAHFVYAIYRTIICVPTFVLNIVAFSKLVSRAISRVAETVWYKASWFVVVLASFTCKHNPVLPG